MSAAPPILLTETVPADQAARDRIQHDLTATLIIEAAAGTGKTTALVSRIVAVLARGLTSLDRIVAVTFTEKAAGELKLRLRAAIECARHDAANFDEAARKHLRDSLEKLEEAHIGTIHSFCADLLRERPIAAGVDPMFEIAPEEVQRALFEAAFGRWFEEALAAPGPALRRILRRRALADREGPRPILAAAARELLEWRDFATPWQDEEFERDAAIGELVEMIEAAGAIAAEADADDWLRRSFELLARPLAEATRLEAVRARDYDALEDTLLRLLQGNQRHWGWKGRGESFGTITRAEAFVRRAAIKARLEDFRERAGANLAPQLRDELWPVIAYYDELKDRAGRLDFLDLLRLARDLIRSNAVVRAELQERFSHIFVDEFQDTDPLQAEILLLLAADDPAATDWLAVTPRPGKLFIVGDPKQSIYRFRRADVALYQSVKQRLLARGAALEHLRVSFRATAEIQQMINAAFAPLMPVESPSQPAYAALEAFRLDAPAQPAIVALPVPAPYSDYGRITDWSIEKSLPDAIAAFIEWLIRESGWTVTERDAPERRTAIRPRHICMLFRRLNQWRGGRPRDVTRDYVRALEGRHLEHVLVRGGSFNQREEVEALRNALAAIERPDDELSVYATMRGPLFALTDAALLRFRETCGSLHPFRSMPPALAAELAEVAAALGVLRELHRGRNRRPIAETIAQLLAKTRAHAGFAIWPTGEQALANLMRLMETARRYEAASGATSLRGFVDLLEERAAGEQAGDAPVVEEGTEGVRVMTVHSAKGLEFPVVILADLTCNETARAARRYVDPARHLCVQTLAGCAPRELIEHAAEELRRDEEEAVRVLYVAATRARDLLVVPVIGDARHDGWLGKLAPALYPDRQVALTPLTRAPEGCPEFPSAFVGTRPPDAHLNGAGVAPGLHRPETGDHRVVWWDPALLKLDARASMGLRQTRLLEADEAPGGRSVAGKQEAEAWRDSRDALLKAGAIPSLRVSIATEAAAAGGLLLEEAATIELIEVARKDARLHGARFGTLVHAILSRVALDAAPDAIAAAALFFGRILGAPEDEVAAASAAGASALASPLLRRAAAAIELRRETPLTLILDDGSLVEGTADLAFLEVDAAGIRHWTVVDYKTDAAIAGRLEEYRAQLALYLRAIARATATPARGILLWL
ncbi:MAG TPA: UvrD-helicase domain-containing protein [Candidatus Binataceae bacterium]|nr:UvrD-helicase domain-containing protein [Candidatus Binataceae bacterium]